MTQEAVKLVLWPIEPKEQEGQTIYSYVVLGVVCTSKPIDWGNESVVLQQFNNTDLTDLLDTMHKYKPDFPLGDASNALLTVVKMNPDDFNEEIIEAEFEEEDV